MAVSDRSNTIVNLTQAADNAAKLVRPQVTDQSTSGTPHDNAQADELIKQLMARGNDISQFQPLIDSIMQRAAISFAPILGEQVSSGGYNSTTLKQLAGESEARATGEATAAVTAAQQEALRTAASLQSAKLQINQTRTSTQKPPFSVGELLKGIGISYAAGKGLKKLEGLKLPGWSSTQESAAASDAGFLPEAHQASLGDDFGFYSSGGGSSDVAGSSIGAGASSSEIGSSLAAPLSSEELSFIMGTAGDSAAANAAAFASMTDASVPAIAESTPGIYGDFGTLSPNGVDAANPLTKGIEADGITGTPLDDGTIVKPFDPGTIEAVPLSDAAAGSDVLTAASSQSALGGSTGVAADSASAIVGDAGGIDAGLETAGGFGEAAGGAGGISAASAGPLIAIPITAEVAGKVGGDLLETAFGGQGGGIIKDVGDFAGSIGSSIGSGAEDIGHSIADAASKAADKVSDAVDTVVCTELYRQGKMSASTRRYNAVWAHRNFNAVALSGYREGWGPLYVRLMQRSKIATKLGLIVMSSWSAWIRGDRTAIIGAVLAPVAFIPSWLIGKWMQVKEVFAHG